MKKFHPILFSSPMVQAILEGRKTMTRRIIKSRHESGLFQIERKLTGEITGITSLDWDERSGNVTNDIHCPYGKIGDVLWVRETYHVNDVSGEFPDIEKKWYNYKADHLDRDPGPMWPPFDKWKPSIFMPKAACRIFLEITNIKVERLKDISEADAKAEGVSVAECCHAYYHGFSILWQKINGKESWEANPFVWVVGFKQIKKPENFC